MNRSISVRVVLWALLAIVLLWTAVPLLWMALSSVKPPGALISTTPQILFTPTVEHYLGLFTGGNNIGRNLANSVVTSVLATVISVSLGTLAGYGLARSHFRGKRQLSFWIITTRMAPIAAALLPLFVLLRMVGLINTLPGIVVAHLTFDLPFAIWLMNAFFAKVPRAMEEAAQVDGASKWTAFWRVAVPPAAPGIVTTAILCLVFSWNDYVFAQTLGGPGSQTLPAAASSLVTQTGIDWGQLTAIGTIIALPMIVAGLLVRRWLVTGLTLGAVSGQ